MMCKSPDVPLQDELLWGIRGGEVPIFGGDPQKAHSYQETRVFMYRSSKSAKKCDLYRRDKESKKERKAKKLRAWQVAYLPRPPTYSYPHQTCHVARLKC